MSKSATAKGNVTGEKVPQNGHSKGKTPKEVVDKHIRDKNDVISEEDFKNLDLNFEINPDEPPPLEISNDPHRPKDEDKDNQATTPWDVLK